VAVAAIGVMAVAAIGVMAVAAEVVVITIVDAEIGIGINFLVS
jgi:hypothetical protein